MKKTLTTIALAGIACGAFAQGTVYFDNDGSGIVNVGASPAHAIGDGGQNPGNAVWNMALLFNSSGTLGLAQSAFTQLVDYIPNATINPLSDGNGSFQDTSGGKEVIINTGVAAGVNTFEVVSWLGTATTWANASLGIGASYTAQSAEFTLPTSDSTATPPGTVFSVNGGKSGSAGWDGNLTLVPVPEPTTIALGGLGAAALLLFRRKK